MAAASQTTHPEEIKQWVEKRGGKPSCVKGTGSENDSGLLRINFPSYSGEDTLEEISWEDFFKKFETEKLAFLYQDEEDSRFFKPVSRDG